MEQSTSEGINPLQRYSLTAKDFKDFSASPITYKFPQRVTRENFTSFFIQSFIVPRAELSMQALWMKYVGLKTGFDAAATIDAFDEAGGLDGALSTSELELFTQEFNRAKIHIKQGIDMRGDFHETFNLLRGELVTSQDDLISGWEHMSQRQFIRALQTFINNKNKKIS